MFENMSWLNEPTSWKADGDSLTLETAASTDFWRKTHYGFIRDTGHFFYGTSDWSLRPLGTARDEITLRLTRQATAVHVQYLERGGSDGQWNSLRLGYLPLKSRCQVGLMACSPERGGLNVRFTDFSIAPSDGINLHP
ncbi:DUF1349 domain-containing protein [Arthrobacter sp. zg-Y179]|uniref:DUF1349 domain-containing protein n=1 Tax=Arthrobacter sp. zg-Y179 TaxID=2894188 RepID=UPI001E329022|nr:DUF1349 domain-containing protein [Arthrobacter sp. zg-Y179]MCC9174886.1 DUF1349 domain-containing protein [Arthrobacter sp. zg-Y179]